MDRLSSNLVILDKSKFMKEICRNQFTDVEGDVWNRFGNSVVSVKKLNTFMDVDNRWYNVYRTSLI